MKKVINITIGQVVFTIEEDAYEKLSKYLTSIKKHFAKDKDKEEILEDIEVGIAEKFLKRTKKKDQVVSIEDVEKVIAQMGTIKDFEKEEDKESAEEDSSQSFVGRIKNKVRNKKLYRNPDDAIIGGVASGLAAYFGLETALVRLAFFITLFFGGLGAVVYLVLWITLPVAETSAQKFEMRGEKMTLQEIEKAVKEGVDKLKKKDFKHVNRFFRGMVNFFLSLIRFIFRIIGAAFVLASIVVICAFSFFLIWSLVGFSVADIQIVLRDFVSVEGFVYWLFVLSIYVSILIPMILLILLGLSFLKMRNTLSLLALVVLFILWFTALGFASSIVFQDHLIIRDKVLDIHAKVSEYEKDHFFEDCFRSGGVPFIENGRKFCDMNDGFQSGIPNVEILKGPSCQTSADCQLPLEYATLSSCPYAPFCEDGECVIGCPLWEYSDDPAKVIDYNLACSEDSDCDCSGWDPEGNNSCECLDGRCVSVVE